MWARALLAFLALPGVVAFTVTVILLWPDVTTRAPATIGLIPFIAGVVLLGLVRAGLLDPFDRAQGFRAQCSPQCSILNPQSPIFIPAPHLSARADGSIARKLLRMLKPRTHL